MSYIISAAFHDQASRKKLLLLLSLPISYWIFSLLHFIFCLDGAGKTTLGTVHPLKVRLSLPFHAALPWNISKLSLALPSQLFSAFS